MSSSDVVLYVHALLDDVMLQTLWVSIGDGYVLS